MSTVKVSFDNKRSKEFAREVKTAVKAYFEEKQIPQTANVQMVDAIERLDPGDAALAALIERHCAPLREAGVAAVALGCTHYPLVGAQIRQAMGSGVQVIDTSDAVAEQVLRRLGALPSPLPSPMTAAGDVLLETTGDPARLQTVASRWLDFAFVVRQAPAALG